MNPAVALTTSLGGKLLGSLFGAVARLRRSKPLHPLGVVRVGTLVVEGGSGRPTGVGLLDQPGSHRCVVRVSRATGVPSPLPDILGVAVRLRDGSAPADILFASTGDGPVSRHVLMPRRTSVAGPLTTLIPLRSPTGPVLLGLFPAGPPGLAEPIQFELRWSRPGRVWRRVGSLQLGDRVAAVEDPPIRFDPVLFPVPGLEHYPAVARLREPAYSGARAGHQMVTAPGLE